MPTDDPFAPLREALAISPTNIPLRLHLADNLLGAGKADEAEAVGRAQQRDVFQRRGQYDDLAAYLKLR